jgi:hypothetical protein
MMVEEKVKQHFLGAGTIFTLNRIQRSLLLVLTSIHIRSALLKWIEIMLTVDHWNILRALMNRIIPQDDFPNAWEAGVGNYLERQFEGDLQHQVENYRKGLESLDGESQAYTGHRFSEMDDLTQDKLLSQIETGQVTLSWSVNPAEFFQMVITHVMEGYYSDPGNGGNRDSISWKMIGFESHE